MPIRDSLSLRRSSGRGQGEGISKDRVNSVERAPPHEPQPKKREQAPRTPNASRNAQATFQREAFGVRPACRRFGFGVSKRENFRGILSPTLCPLVSRGQRAYQDSAMVVV